MEHIRRKGNQNRIVQHKTMDVEYLTFPILEKTGIVKHLFSTRLGGISQDHLSTMNLSYSRGDEKARVDENFRRIAAVLGRDVGDFVFSDQTHTVNVRKITEEDRGKGMTQPIDYQNIDGLVTDVEGIVLSTFYADCVPLFFVDPVNRVIGLSHSGWRGTVAGIGAVTVRKMQEEYGSRPEQIVAAIGPSICQDCYEVGLEVAEVFTARFGAEKAALILKEKGEGKYLLDLWSANQFVLLEAGILKEQICTTDICTCCNPRYLFSHRASHGKRGNLGAFLSLEREKEADS